MSAYGLVILLSLHLLLTSARTSQAEEPPAASKGTRGKRPGRKVVTIPVDAPKRPKDMSPLMHAKLGHSQKCSRGL